MSDFTRAEFDQRWQHLDQSLDRHADRIVARLDKINGRLRETEQRVAVLEDRDDRELHAARSLASRWGAGIAAIVSASVSYFLGGE